MAKKKPLKFKESIGIDIGTHSVKLVHLKKLNEGYKLLNYEIRPTVPDGIEYVPSDLRRDRHAPVISEIMRSLRINPKKVNHLVTAVGGEQVSIKQIKTIFSIALLYGCIDRFGFPFFSVACDIRTHEHCHIFKKPCKLL